jgi:hypothetical protein
MDGESGAISSAPLEDSPHPRTKHSISALNFPHRSGTARNSSPVSPCVVADEGKITVPLRSS